MMRRNDEERRQQNENGNFLQMELKSVGMEWEK